MKTSSDAVQFDRRRQEEQGGRAEKRREERRKQKQERDAHNVHFKLFILTDFYYME